MLSRETVAYSGERIVMRAAGDAILLHQTYHCDQHWLPLGSVFLYPDRPPSTPSPNSVNNQRKKARRRFERSIANERIVLADYTGMGALAQKGVAQYVMAFEGHRWVRGASLTAEISAGFPSWERTQDGELLVFRDRTPSRKGPQPWYETALKGRFLYDYGHVAFERADDAALAKMFLDLQPVQAKHLPYEWRHPSKAP